MKRVMWTSGQVMLGISLSALAKGTNTAKATGEWSLCYVHKISHYLPVPTVEDSLVVPSGPISSLKVAVQSSSAVPAIDLLKAGLEHPPIASWGRFPRNR